MTEIFAGTRIALSLPLYRPLLRSAVLNRHLRPASVVANQSGANSATADGRGNCCRDNKRAGIALTYRHRRLWCQLLFVNAPIVRKRGSIMSAWLAYS